MRGAERPDLSRVGFRNLAGEMNLIICHDQNAAGSRFTVSGDGDRVIEIHRSIRADGGGGTHRADEHDGLVGRYDEIQEERSLLHRVRAVRDHDARNITPVERNLRACGKRSPSRFVHVLAADRGDLFDIDSSQRGKLRHGRNQCPG
jgi:hypothetical protein